MDLKTATSLTLDSIKSTVADMLDDQSKAIDAIKVREIYSLFPLSSQVLCYIQRCVSLYLCG
jgi:hypothetical protein